MPITRDFSIENGVYVFDSSLDHRSTYDSSHLEILKEAENSHFWFSARRSVILRFFENHVDKKSRILEIGGGTGFIAEGLIAKGFAVEMADIHSNGLRIAKDRGIEKLYQFDLFSPPFFEEFDIICFFDVLEHLSEEHQAIECIKKMLKPGGKIILTVPAHQWLWCRDDAIAGHKRRYTLKHLQDVFFAASLKTIQIKYFFISILPFLLLRKWFKKDTGLPLKNEECVEMSLNSLLNRAFKILMKVELYFERHLPNQAGGSLLAYAQKPLNPEK